MLVLSSKIKIAQAIAGTFVALIVTWILVDPFAEFFLLVAEKEVDIDFNTIIPITGRIDKH